MPLTPFHFGPGAVVHAVAPKQVSFLAFCAANILIDIEPLYYMVTQQLPLHRFFHTYIGATVILLGTLVLFTGGIKVASLVALPNVFGWQQLTSRPVAVGAALGSYSHVALDSIMHADIRPFAPLSDDNPLLHTLSLSALHWSCIAAGIVGLIIIGIRDVLSRDNGL